MANSGSLNDRDASFDRDDSELYVTLPVEDMLLGDRVGEVKVLRGLCRKMTHEWVICTE